MTADPGARPAALLRAPFFRAPCGDTALRRWRRRIVSHSPSRADAVQLPVANCVEKRVFLRKVCRRTMVSF
jgi:hypothetical protein